VSTSVVGRRRRDRGVVVYAVNMVNKVEDNLKPEENATSLVEEIQTLEEYKGDVVNILVCGIDY